MQKQFRLRDHRGFKRVYRQGRSVHGKLIDAKYAANRQDFSRVGVVVSTKVSKSAVKRNRMRRRLQGLLREGWSTLRPGYDIVLIVRKDIAASSSSEIRAEIEQAVARIGG